LKENVDLTLNRVFSGGNFQNRGFLWQLERRFTRGLKRKPWIYHDNFMRDNDNYSKIDRSNMLIIVGDKDERYDTGLCYEENYGLKTCARCGADLNIKPWMRIFHYDLCERCDKELTKEHESKNRKPWS